MARRRARKPKLTKGLFVTLVILLLLICIAGFVLYKFYPDTYKKWFGLDEVQPSGEVGAQQSDLVTLASNDVSVHFLELGNEDSGDCSLIKVGDVEVLVDAGSDTNSIDTISAYIDKYCTDDILEYVIVTHGDTDHIACFAGTGGATYQTIFDRYDCRTIIDFPKTTKSTATYNRYISERDAEIAKGAVHYDALQCYNNEGGASRIITLADGVEIEFLYNIFYEEATTDENENSVCFILRDDNYKYLFTGDLENAGEKALVDNNQAVLGKVDVFKAGHHGSKTSNTIDLLNVIDPEIVVFCCAMGRNQYHALPENIFPTQIAVDNVMQYTTNMYCSRALNEETGDVELYNGNIVIVSNASGMTVHCSNITDNITHNAWFQKYRMSA